METASRNQHRVWIEHKKKHRRTETAGQDWLPDEPHFAQN
jgi:hypothetical protein